VDSGRGLGLVEDSARPMLVEARRYGSSSLRLAARFGSTLRLAGLTARARLEARPKTHAANLSRRLRGRGLRARASNEVETLNLQAAKSGIAVQDAATIYGSA